MTRQRAQLLFLAFFLSATTSHDVVADILFTDERGWTSDAVYFQNLTQPTIVYEEQTLSVKGHTFVHPTGVRYGMDVATILPSTPIGISVRWAQLPESSGTENSLFEAGAFWTGTNKNFAGQLGLSFVQEGAQHFQGKRYFKPQMTIQTLHSNKRVQSLQHISVPVALDDQAPDFVHSSHLVTYTFHLGSQFYLGLGLQFDLLLTLGKSTRALTFAPANRPEREVFQGLGGPLLTLHHPYAGEFIFRASQPLLITADIEESSRLNMRVILYPALHMAYSLAF